MSKKHPTIEDRERQRRWSSDHYRRNKRKYIAKAGQSGIKNRDRVRMLKESTPCSDCGRMYPYYVMQYDHRDPNEKKFDIGCGYRNHGWSDIEAEIKKCDCVCANCHAIRCHKDKSWANRRKDDIKLEHGDNQMGLFN